MQLNLSKLHPLSEQMVNLVCTKVQNQDKAFFRVEVAYYLAKLASNMHVSVRTGTNNIMPVNVFAMAYADSGYGKNFSQNIIEEQMMGTFEEIFTEELYPQQAKLSIAKKAHVIAVRAGLDEFEVEASLTKDFEEMGEFLYGFPEGTSPALKQLCKSITYAGIGAASLEMDEIGYNITANQDMLTTLLELYDVGKTKDKLTKVTKEAKRGKSIKGFTPANVFAFGTPLTAFDGGKTEECIQGLLKAGYGRRCFFAYGDVAAKFAMAVDSDEVYAQLADITLSEEIEAIDTQLAELAKPNYVGTEVFIGTKAERFRLKYNQYCHERAVLISEYRPVERAEMMHRVAKVTKLAGAYAFIDQSLEVTVDHIEYAIALAEISGASLKRILNQPKAHVRLANFLCDFGSAVTEADLVEYLPFYSGSVSSKKDLITLAIAYGHRNAMAITAFEESGVAMWKGETLVPTVLSELILSTSYDIADDYSSVYGSIESIAKYVTEHDANFCNHHFNNGQIGKGNRCKANTIPGANLVVFDIDQTKFKPEILHALLSGHNHVIYETKSSTPEEPRYRLILVLSHVVKLDDVDYKAFCKNIATWLPVNADLPAMQRERKYRTYSGCRVWSVTDGANLNVMAYYPRTAEAENNLKFNKTLIEARIKGMAKWVIHTAAMGNRNNTLYSYTRFLVEHSSYDAEKIAAQVRAINSKLVEPLDDIELNTTILSAIKP